jgi:hypothetical protein
VWSRVLNEYLMGERPGVNDLMAWNADGTRMPYAMHSEYLRRLFLHNDLAEGRFLADGRAIALSSIRQPLFVVGTETDHVAPWHSVHKIHMLTSAAITFVLTSGGHNAGIVSEPGHKHRHYHMLERREGQAALSPDDWLTQANPYEDRGGRHGAAGSTPIPALPCRLRRWAPRTRAIPDRRRAGHIRSGELTDDLHPRKYARPGYACPEYDREPHVRGNHRGRERADLAHARPARDPAFRAGLGRRQSGPCRS